MANASALIEAFVHIHGSPLEGGACRGYLEMQGILYTCCNGYERADHECHARRHSWHP
ncbi:MAG: hypothetical protein R2778_13635 [Saprospiraceae bacterium]